jgi:hypothetical protein
VAAGANAFDLALHQMENPRCLRVDHRTCAGVIVEVTRKRQPIKA